MLPVCLNGNALEELLFEPQELKTQVANQPAPTLRALFVHMDLVMRVIRSNRAGQTEFRSRVQKDVETLQEFARRVRSMGSLVFAHQDLDERGELLRGRLLKDLNDPEILEILCAKKPETLLIRLRGQLTWRASHVPSEGTRTRMILILRQLNFMGEAL